MSRTVSTLLATPAVIAVVATTATADVLDVPGDHATIQAALDASAAGDEIVVAPGTYAEALLIPGHPLTLRARDGAATTILDATGLDADATVFFHTDAVRDTELRGFTLRGGAGAVILIGRPTIADCVFEGHAALDDGGTALQSNWYAQPLITGCTFDGRTAPDGAKAFSTFYAAQTVFQDCVFAHYPESDGVLRIDDGVVATVNCTFAASDAPAVSIAIGSIIVRNSVLWNDADQQIVSELGTIDMAYTNVRSGWFGPGILTVDPAFEDAAAGDFALRAGSPCIDAGRNDNVLQDIGWDLDLPASSTDVAGNPRRIDALDVLDSGFGLGTPIDLGAFEFVPPCFGAGDVDQNGSIGFSDLMTLLAAWGPCSGCPSDLDRDGGCDFDDVVQCLAAWGPCTK